MLLGRLHIGLQATRKIDSILKGKDCLEYNKSSVNQDQTLFNRVVVSVPNIAFKQHVLMCHVS